MDPELKEHIETDLRDLLATGFYHPEQVVEGLCEMYGDQAKPKEIRSLAAKNLPARLAAIAAEQKSWPATTDCDRLDAAFEELNTLGIMARHNWTASATDGSDAMGDEFDRIDGKWKGTPITGYAFYHAQDTQSAAQGHGLTLLFGSTVSGGGEAAYNKRCGQVAATVCRVLKAHGLTPEWSGSHEERIMLPIDWKRRECPARFFEGDDSVE